MIPQYMKTARSLIGTKEIVGKKDNPVVMAMYADVGHKWVQHDEVAWCAAFVGSCLEKNGIRSTRKLNARSYLDWGVEVPLSKARKGDIVIFERGGPQSWKGHVAFFEGVAGTKVKVLGGNQANAVNVKPYSKSKVLGVRRAKGAALGAEASKDVVHKLQARLHALKYYEVGTVDGVYGPRTKAAILAFREDNKMELTPEIDAELIKRLTVAQPKPISEARATGKPENSRILTGAKIIQGTAAFGAVGGVINGISDVVGTAEQVKDTTSRAFGLLDFMSGYWPWVGVGLAVIAGVAAWKVGKARIEDYQEGKTP